MNRIKALLFDCDGVLLDSEPLGCRALAEAVTAAGRPMTFAEARQVFSGCAAEDSRAWMAREGLEAAEVFAESDEILFRMFASSIPLIPGIEAVLRDFPLKMAICSNASHRRLAVSVCRTTIASRFGPHIYSADHVEKPKPAPDLALHACRELGVAPHEALFIDDNFHGIHCAKAAGCLAVGFVGPSDDRPGHDRALWEAGADHVVHGIAEFQNLLRTLTIKILEDA
ncbi:haloacid dehalogenase [Nitratireductor aestuarii]|uniref:phosphoglycolate phosphatase n=1 Tax=Nitratireductor aestuarii TaxID=1735103 RepID=A0A916S512_9HYPH|nr:HAD family phosphatase [Nitratireductor aestuarii]GGA81358.1 haloacid dehalogenase [Nitratireductor aestuarii]